MSLTITEANAVNTVIEALLGCHAYDFDHSPLPKPDALLDALVVLARSAHKPLMAGYDAERVERRYREVRKARAELVERLRSRGDYPTMDAAAAELERLWGRR